MFDGLCDLEGFKVREIEFFCEDLEEVLWIFFEDIFCFFGIEAPDEGHGFGVMEGEES